MRLEVTFKAKHFLSFQQRCRLLSDGKWRKEMQRGVVDAGRKVKTKVQRAVNAQMAVAPGHYQDYVVANTSGISRPGNLSFEISGRKKGAPIETYKGLRALKAGGRAEKRMNAGRGLPDHGYVRSGVWNAPRTFQRSFVQDGGFFALIPSSSESGSLPKAFWTFGAKPDQPRDAAGRFGKTGRKGFRVRSLYGPALGKELPKDASLKTFLTEGPKELEIQIRKRSARLIRF